MYCGALGKTGNSQVGVSVHAVAGIRQFIDLGVSVPTVGNIHDIIRRRRRKARARVVYVDYEPVAAGQGRQVLDEDEVTH
jgi:hypothetical protein